MFIFVGLGLRALEFECVGILDPRYSFRMMRSLTKIGWAEPAEEETQTGRGTWTTSKTRYRLDSLGSQENCIGPLNLIGFSLTN